MLIDSHLHLNMIAKTLQEQSKVVKEAITEGVSHLLLISTCFKSFFNHLEVQRLFPREISISLGFGPNSIVTELPNESEYLKIIVENDLTAIGEIGLDYYHDYGSRKEQISFFSRQLQIVQNANLPVIIHTRDADSDTLAVLKDFPEVKGVIHCFSSNVAFGEAVLDLGYYISFSGNLTFKRNEQIVQAAKVLPLNRMLIETDAPFLSPVPMRGKPNLPSFLIYTASFLAGLRNISVDEVAQITTANYEHIFKKEL